MSCLWAAPAAAWAPSFPHPTGLTRRWHPGSSFPWALPAWQGPPAPHSREEGLHFLKQQQNLLHFAFQKSLSLSKGNEGPAGWEENTRRLRGL